MLVQEGLPGRPQLGRESHDLDLVLQVLQTFNVRTVRVRVDVLKPLDDGRNVFFEKYRVPGFRIRASQKWKMTVLQVLQGTGKNRILKQLSEPGIVEATIPA